MENLTIFNIIITPYTWSSCFSASAYVNYSTAKSVSNVKYVQSRNVYSFECVAIADLTQAIARALEWPVYQVEAWINANLERVIIAGPINVKNKSDLTNHCN